MNCWCCDTPLIWGGDHDVDTEDDNEHAIETNLSCPGCGELVFVFWGGKD